MKLVVFLKPLALHLAGGIRVGPFEDTAASPKDVHLVSTSRPASGPRSLVRYCLLLTNFPAGPTTRAFPEPNAWCELLLARMDDPRTISTLFP